MIAPLRSASSGSPAPTFHSWTARVRTESPARCEPSTSSIHLQRAHSAAMPVVHGALIAPGGEHGVRGSAIHTS